MDRYYAHSAPEGRPWEPLFTPKCEALSSGNCEACENLDPRHGHLNKVAWWTAKFAEEMFVLADRETRDAARRWGYLAGLWHDIGKFSDKFQAYLLKAAAQADPHRAETEGEPVGRVDHSTAGARYSAQTAETWGSLLSFAIAGHHSGLPDGLSSKSCLARRLNSANPIPPYSLPSNFPKYGCLPPPPIALNTEQSGFDLALWIRMMFSCLVDADFLATEAFMSPKRFDIRETIPGTIMVRMETALETHYLSFGEPSNEIDAQREYVRRRCLDAAANTPGFFTLTVPTGGGKTLASLAFALRHAIRYGFNRIIYVVPFTTIIEQNAEEYRKVFRELQSEFRFRLVIEHHCNLDPKKDTIVSRLASENWDAPVVITTNVQFLESLFSTKTSRCRKLHRIARSVVIFDEAQNLPVPLLAPTLAAMDALTRDFGVTQVLCTATQPTLHKRTGFPIGIPISKEREVIPNVSRLFAKFHRAEATYIGVKDDAELIALIAENQHEVSLTVLNTRRHAFDLARGLMSKIGKEGVFHLSAQMCAAHRSAILGQSRDPVPGTIRHALAKGLSCRVISTQLIEAGVDLDFPVVFRAETGLDSLSQAAGRCDRHGKRTKALGHPAGKVYFFSSKDHPVPPGYLRQTWDVTKGFLEEHGHNLLGLEAIGDYFDRHYLRQGTLQSKWDKPGVMECLDGAMDEDGEPCPNLLQFAKAAEAFKIIEDNQVAVTVGWSRKGERLLRAIDLLDEHMKRLNGGKRKPSRRLLRLAQRYTVEIHKYAADELFRRNELLFRCGERFVIPARQSMYSDQFGLLTPANAAADYELLYAG